MTETADIHLEPLGARNEKEWDALVDLAHNGHLMARSGFFGYHADRFEDASLFFRRRRRPLGVLPANRDGDTLWSHQGVSFGGLILHPRTHFAHVGAAVTALLAHLRAEGFARLMYRPAPHPYHLCPREEDIYFLEQAGARRVDTRLHSMVICGAPAALRAKSWNHTVRRALDTGVRVRPGTGDELAAVWAMVEERLRLIGQQAVHSLDDLLLLRSRFPDSIQLFVGESGGGVLLGGQVLFRFGHTLTLMYLGDVPEGREVNVGTIIQHHLLTAAENTGCWFDLGQWCDTRSREGSDGLLQFKEAAGGRLVQRHTWELLL